jgi:2-polyprenyl-3-methyl-5-hydroxy-6-metoxy-1,4-benzoquinol methylase
MSERSPIGPSGSSPVTGLGTSHVTRIRPAVSGYRDTVETTRRKWIMKDEEIRKLVREGYAEMGRSGKSCCGESSCCGSRDTAQDISRAIGYSEEDLEGVPEGSNLGLGCGNPLALASLKEGDVVLDLGSGAGFDCFLAAKAVGKGGKVIGIDMTPEMIDKARENAKKSEYENVEFRLGEIENIPAADSCADVVISNCVINLSPEKARVFK